MVKIMAHFMRSYLNKDRIDNSASNPAVFVQEPDFVDFYKVPLPLHALGVIYDALDPYVTPLGVIFAVREGVREREIYVPRGLFKEESLVIYTHDLDDAHYVLSRNGFEEEQLHLSAEPVSEDAKELLRAFFDRQNTPRMNRKYLVQVRG